MQWERGWYKRRLPYIGTPPVPAAPRALVLPPRVVRPPLPAPLTRGSVFFSRPPLAPAASGPAVTKATGSGVTSLTLGVPAGTVAGDLLVTFLALDSVSAVTAPSGWVLPQSQPYATNTFKLWAFYHQAGSSEPASYTWTGPSAHWIGCCVRVAGGGVPEDSQSAAGTNSPASAPSLTTLGTNRTILTGFGLVSQTDTPAAPQVSTGLQQIPSFIGLDVTYFTQGSAGATGALTATLSPSAPWAAADLAIPGGGAAPFGILPPRVVRQDFWRRGSVVFARPPLRLPPAGTPGGVLPPRVVRSDYGRRGVSVFTRPPTPAKVPLRVLPPRVVRSDFIRRGTALFVRPPLHPPPPASAAVFPPRVVRADFWRRGQAVFIRPPWKAVGPPRILPPQVVRSDFTRRGLVYLVRKLAPKINVPGGVLPPRVFTPPLPLRLTRASVYQTVLFHTGAVPAVVPMAWATDDGARPWQTMSRRPWKAAEPDPLQAWVNWPGAEQQMAWQDQIGTPPVRRPWRPAADTSGLPERAPDIPALTLAWLPAQEVLRVARRVFRAEPDTPPPSPLAEGLSILAWQVQEAFLWPRRVFRALTEGSYPGLPAGDAAQATGWQQDSTPMRWRRPTWRATELPDLPPLAALLDLPLWEAALYQSHPRLLTRPAFRAAEVPGPVLVALPVDVSGWVAAMQPADGRIVTARRQFIVDTGDPAALLWRAVPLPLDQQFAATQPEHRLLRARRVFVAGDGAAPVLDATLQTAVPFVPPPGGEMLPAWYRRPWRPSGYEFAAPPWIAGGVVKVLGPFYVVAGQLWVAGAAEGDIQSAD